MKQVEENGWEAFLWIGLGGVAIGSVIGWGLAARKKNAQIAQIKEEWRKTSGDNFEKLSQKKAAAVSKSQDLDIAKRSMVDALRRNKAGNNNLEELRSCREELCNIYQNDYLMSSTEYVELIPRLVDKREALIRAQTELIPGLESVCGFLELVNMKEMLDKIPNSQLFKLNKARRDGLFLRIKTLVPFWRLDLLWKIRKIKKKTDKHLRN